MQEIEELWDALLSREPEQVRRAFATLTASEQQAVLTHLQRMASESGWHPEQVISARAALLAIHEPHPPTNSDQQRLL